jgi:2-dehydro-3-deoxyphosphogluconate aldolase/(4S)-4-hydroxy-2-oxoglutarate aldolase
METLLAQKIIPVLSMDEPQTALRAVAAMQEGGVNCVEVALRSTNALRVLEDVARTFPEMMVGAGTVREVADFSRITSAGAMFAVSPGSTKVLLDESRRWDIPYVPAAATVSEILQIMALDFTVIKLFPAGSLGGVKYIKDIAAPLPDARFVPSGGVNLDNLGEFLQLESVAAVSGSWMLNAQLVANQDWAGITKVCKTSLAIAAG